jgi:hypothetical protein
VCDNIQPNFECAPIPLVLMPVNKTLKPTVTKTVPARKDDERQEDERIKAG